MISSKERPDGPLFFTVSVPGLTFLGTKGISVKMVGRLMFEFRRSRKEGQNE
jgi:hypothetical protein